MAKASARPPESLPGGEDDDEDDMVQRQFKVILLGDGTVGKTSIAVRFTEDQFTNKYKQTIGVDFFLKRVVLPGNVRVTVQLWDIGGQSIGGKMIKNYIFGAHAVLFVYDMTNYDSFQNLEDWYRLVRQTFAKQGTLPYLALLANKNDLTHLKTVQTEMHNRFADENNMHGFSISAKSGNQVQRTFLQIAADLAGVELSKNEMGAYTEVVPAQIINHPQHDANISGGKVHEYTRGELCTVS